ncbi:MAG: hypothetical protein IPN50_11215 [Sphingomonadales bacterium]|nr:hypothetical protein [Sphingomonadales bacterium]
MAVVIQEFEAIADDGKGEAAGGKGKGEPASAPITSAATTRIFAMYQRRRLRLRAH